MLQSALHEIRTLAQFSIEYFKIPEYPVLPNRRWLVCLHGYASCPSSFASFASRFSTEYNVLIPVLNTLHFSIAQLAENVETELQSRNITDYLLVGHSLGAMIALVHQSECANTRAHALVAIAAPFFGCPLSIIGIGPVKTDLQNLALLEKIRTHAQQTPSLLLIQATNDWVIPIYEFPNCKMIAGSHCSILETPRLAELCDELFEKQIIFIAKEPNPNPILPPLPQAQQ